MQMQQTRLADLRIAVILPCYNEEKAIGRVIDDFRKNARSELGTRTATLHAQGIAKLRNCWIYRS